MRTGRPPKEGKTRERVVCSRLTEEDVQILDASRGADDRSTYIRRLIRENRSA